MSNDKTRSVYAQLTSRIDKVTVFLVPREDTNVFRITQRCNPLQAPLLADPAKVYVDCEYILSTNITTVSELIGGNRRE